MTKFEKVRQYMEISGIDQSLSSAMRELASVMSNALSKMAGFSERDAADITKELDDKLVEVVPTYLVNCAHALTDLWSDEIVDYQLREAAHPLSVATRKTLPQFREKTKTISEALMSKLSTEIAGRSNIQ